MTNIRKNYLPWSVRMEDFGNLSSEQDQLKFLLYFGLLAPSSHNTQPWRFSIKNNQIIVGAAYDRSLPTSDANNRQLFISLGCAVENIIIAADYYGYVSSVTYEKKFPGDPFVATIILAHSPNSSGRDAKHLIFSIPKRHTNRNKYTDRMPDKEFLDQISSLATQTLRIDFISDNVRKQKIADTVLAAGEHAMEDKNFRKELSHYLKSNITKSAVGMPGFGFGFPTPLSFLAPYMLRLFNMAKLTKREDEALLKKYTPMYAIISTSNDTQEDWIKAGRIYERIALIATKSHMRTAPMAAPIQIGEHYKDLQKILGIQSRPQIFFRMGYCDQEMKHSPRLAVNKVIEH